MLTQQVDSATYQSVLRCIVKEARKQYRTQAALITWLAWFNSLPTLLAAGALAGCQPFGCCLNDALRMAGPQATSQQHTSMAQSTATAAYLLVQENPPVVVWLMSKTAAQGQGEPNNPSAAACEAGAGAQAVGWNVSGSLSAAVHSMLSCCLATLQGKPQAPTVPLQRRYRLQSCSNPPILPSPMASRWTENCAWALFSMLRTKQEAWCKRGQLHQACGSRRLGARMGM